MAAKTQIVKYIERGITAAKKFFGNSKTSGPLSDEQLGRGLNMFERKGRQSWRKGRCKVR